MKKDFYLFVWGLLFLPAGVLAQITITSSDLLGLIGKSQSLESDTSDGVTINVGAAGANQTWDFRTLTLLPETLTLQFITPQGTPFANRVPQANFVQRGALSSQPGTIFYNYSRVTSTEFRSLGAGAVASSDSSFSLTTAQDVVPLSLQFGAAWISTQTDTFGDPQTGAFINVSTSNNSVDAWGVVRLPIGDFDCLRIRDNEVAISKLVVSGMVVVTDTTRTINYTWVAKNDFQVARVSSDDGETNPNFTTGFNFTRLGSRTTGVAHRPQGESVPTDFTLSQNFPNPFNPETEISFRMARAEQTELSIYNIAGEKVRTLVSGMMPPGNYSIKWNGKDDHGKGLASGTYLYRLKTGRFEMSKKMTLLQ
jgi:hypothetical protein